MKDEIKRAAQFLFDNAEFLSQEMARGDNYRALEIKFNHFKSNGGTKEVELSFYDSAVTHYKLIGPQITIGRFRELCCQMNEDAGVVPLPEAAKIRESLE